VSDNKGIHPDSELVVKDWEGTWQEIREKTKQAQERQRKWHDFKETASSGIGYVRRCLTGESQESG